jgi:CHRD domain
MEDNSVITAQDPNQAVATDVTAVPTDTAAATDSSGTSIQGTEFDAALDRALEDGSNVEDHLNTGPKVLAESMKVSMGEVTSPDALSTTGVKQVQNIAASIGRLGDFLDPGAGTNTVIGSGGSDVVVGTGGGFNTITTGTGRDVLVLGKNTSNRVFDFDPTKDILALADGLNASDITVAQGTNPGKGGLNQPLDSKDSTLVIDDTSGKILAALTFTNSNSVSKEDFVDLRPGALEAVSKLADLAKVQKGDGQLTGTRQSDKLVGGGGDDFLYVGNDGFVLNPAKSGEEFPFKTDSPGSAATSNITLSSGVLSVDTTYQNFDGAPLFSQGEKLIAPEAILLNGANADAFVAGFLAVTNDVEGNATTGTHLHYSPAGDDRGNFADATVLRFFDENVESAKSGRVSGQFNLSPEEQAALLGGDLYLNIHTNVDLDGDGKGGFPTGESRTNLNKDVVKFV